LAPVGDRGIAETLHSLNDCMARALQTLVGLNSNREHLLVLRATLRLAAITPAAKAAIVDLHNVAYLA